MEQYQVQRAHKEENGKFYAFPAPWGITSEKFPLR